MIRAVEGAEQKRAGLALWMPRLLLCVAAEGLWFLLWNADWQSALQALPWVRVAVAFALVIAPGALLVPLLGGGARSAGWSRVPVVGLALALALNGVVGLIALLTHQSLIFVMTALWLAGAAALPVVAIRAMPRAIVVRRSPKESSSFRSMLSPLLPPMSSRATLAAALLALVATTAAAGLAIGRQLNPDDYGYNAYLTYYRAAPSWGFQEILFGTGQIAAPRQWIAFLPLNQAVIAQLSGVSGFRLLSTFLPPLLVLLSALAVYNLARALGLRASLAFSAVAAQVACLLLAIDQVQVGRAFFNRLAEDKAVVAFILAPVLMSLTVEFLRQPGWRALALTALTGLGMVWTHPTMAGLAYLIAGLYGALDWMLKRRTLPLVSFGAGGLAVLSVPLALRFVDTPYTRKLGSDLSAAQLTNFQQNYLWIIGDRLYGLNPEVVAGPAFLLVLAAGLAALYGLRGSRAARYLVASLMVLIAGIVPLTGWIIGAAITAPHMDRLPWFTPFGIGVVFLAFQMARAAKRHVPLARRAFTANKTAARLEWIVPLAAALLMLVAVARTLPPPNRAVEALDPAHDESRRYDDYEALARQLDVLISAQALVVAEDIDLTNVVPALTPKARVLVFRNRRNMWVFGNLEQDEIDRRWEAWKTMSGGDTPNEQRLAALRDNRVNFVLTDTERGWVQLLVDAFPDRFTSRGSFGVIRLYEFASD